MFLKKVYQQWRTFFWVIIIMILSQLFFVVKGIENVPFFLYHMYSYAHPPKDSFNVILIKTGKGYPDLSKLSGREYEMLMNNVYYFNKMKKNDYRDYILPTIENRFRNRVPANTFTWIQNGLVNDSLDFLKYPDWWHRYYVSLFKDSTNSVSLISSYIYFRPRFSKSPVDSVIFTFNPK